MDDNDFDFFCAFEPEWFYGVGIHGDSKAPAERNAAALQAVPVEPFGDWEEAGKAARELSCVFPGVLVGVWRVSFSYEDDTNAWNENLGDLESVWLDGVERPFVEVIK